MADLSPNERLHAHADVIEHGMRELLRCESGWTDETTLFDKTEQYLDTQNYALPQERTLRWMLLTTLRRDTRIEIDLAATNDAQHRRYRADPEWIARRASEIIHETAPLLASGLLPAEYVEPFATSVAQLFYEQTARRRYATGNDVSTEFRSGVDALYSVMRDIGWAEQYDFGSEPEQRQPAQQPLPSSQVERVFLALRAIADDWYDRLSRVEPNAAEAISRAVSWLRGSIDRYLHIAFEQHSPPEKRQRVSDVRDDWTRVTDRMIAAGLSERSCVDFIGLSKAIDEMSTVAANGLGVNDEHDYEQFNQATFAIVLAYRNLKRVRYEPFVAIKHPSADDLAKRAAIIEWLSKQVDFRHSTHRPLKVPAELMLRAVHVLTGFVWGFSTSQCGRFTLPTGAD